MTDIYEDISETVERDVQAMAEKLPEEIKKQILNEEEIRKLLRFLFSNVRESQTLLNEAENKIKEQKASGQPVNREDFLDSVRHMARLRAFEIVFFYLRELFDSRKKRSV